LQRCFTSATLIGGVYKIMATDKNRITVNIDDDLNSDLESLKELSGTKSKAAIIVELAKEALELREDLYFAKIAEERMNEEKISHDEFWKLVKKK